MRINIILPFMSKKPVGGIKILYQYADFLAGRGHKIILYHTIVLKNAPRKYLNPLRIIRNKICYKTPYPSWFSFKNKVDSRIIFKATNLTIENAEIIISTMYATAFDVFELDKSKGKKINVIQDYETWITTEKELIKSYQLPINHIVINDYLFDIVKKHSSKEPILIYNAIDTEFFFLENKIEKRNPRSICMMYSEEKRKGSIYGIKAIERCKEKFDDLAVTFFSVFPRPENLPSWIKFEQMPNNLREIYNKSSVFFTPSLAEGWGLPATEAMMCGCALVCTNVDGHLAYAKDNETALLVESKNTEDMAEKIIFLLENNEKRIEIAKKGNQYVQKFSWEKVINQLERIFIN